MRSQDVVFVLLAVVSNVSAGLVRYHDRPVRQVTRTSPARSNPLTSHRVHHYVRSYNQSTFAADASQPAEPSPVTSSLSSSSETIQSPTTIAKPTTLSKQIGSVPAEGSGPNAAKIDPVSLEQLLATQGVASSSSLAAASPEALTQTSPSAVSTTAPSRTFSLASNPQNIQSTSESTGQTAATLESSTTSATRPASTFTTRRSLGTDIAMPASEPQPQLATSSSGSLVPSASSSTQAQGSPTALVPTSLVPTVSSASTTSSSPTSSSSQPSGPSLSDIPIARGGNVAIANAYNQQFKTLTPESACSSKDRTQAHACIDGLFAECNNAGRYTMTACSPGQQCFALPMPAESIGIFVQCEKPSDANLKLQSDSVSSSSSTAASNTASATSSVPTSASPAATALPTTLASSTLTQSQADTPSTQTRELTTTQIVSQASPSSSVTQPAPAGASMADQPSPLPLPPTQSSAATGASSTDEPLIISFPSTLPSTVPQPSIPPSKPTKQQNPAPAPAAPSPVAPQELSTQPLPLQQPPASTPTVAATTTSAAAPGITIVPLGDNNGNSGNEKTVTMTVTTTERL
ncbi:MAG: hypothetical protein Q9208_001843 [Pyrenodesmia sp. 3 TL-2023]